MSLSFCRFLTGFHLFSDHSRWAVGRFVERFGRVWPLLAIQLLWTDQIVSVSVVLWSGLVCKHFLVLPVCPWPGRAPGRSGRGMFGVYGPQVSPDRSGAQPGPTRPWTRLALLMAGSCRIAQV